MKKQSEIRFGNDIGIGENSKINFNKPNPTCIKRILATVYIGINYLVKWFKSNLSRLKGMGRGSVS